MAAYVVRLTPSERAFAEEVLRRQLGHEMHLSSTRAVIRTYSTADITLIDVVRFCGVRGYTGACTAKTLDEVADVLDHALKASWLDHKQGALLRALASRFRGSRQAVRWTKRGTFKIAD